eukprot:TRINITY_DN85708_c0_g1_i1.p1 TRINITY_DN85708_c0_g1~~TRINITY_DN85708_c0_g1_i1.p1  ORF type:complete len:286 (-),score=41.69 TRINITY_DN85708_c0_g1_i1:47-904(-)
MARCTDDYVWKEQLTWQVKREVSRSGGGGWASSSVELKANPFQSARPYFARGLSHSFYNDSSKSRLLLAPNSEEPLSSPRHRTVVDSLHQLQPPMLQAHQAAGDWSRMEAEPAPAPARQLEVADGILTHGGGLGSREMQQETPIVPSPLRAKVSFGKPSSATVSLFTAESFFDKDIDVAKPAVPPNVFARLQPNSARKPGPSPRRRQLYSVAGNSAAGSLSARGAKEGPRWVPPAASKPWQPWVAPQVAKTGSKAMRETMPASTWSASRYPRQPSNPNFFCPPPP